MNEPRVFNRREELAEFVRTTKKAGKSVGFVPTMGALHDGHGQLIAESSKANDETLVSIFVNPTQFGPQEDFSRYPRTFSTDLALAEKFGCSAIFAPSVQEMYPDIFRTHIHVAKLDEVFCGQYRPGHFDGVCTVVLLLLNLAMADKAYFGMKDFQQLQIIRRMCQDMAHPTEIVGVPTVREPDGLAMSSRNRYLDPAARIKALAVSRSLAAAGSLFLKGERQVDLLRGAALGVLHEAGLEPQYLEIKSLMTLEALSIIESGAVLALAQIMSVPSGTCRLIDNVVLADDPFHRSLIESLVACVSI